MSIIHVIVSYPDEEALEAARITSVQAVGEGEVTGAQLREWLRPGSLHVVYDCEVDDQCADHGGPPHRHNSDGEPSI